jgi:hypothetical protein
MNAIQLQREYFDLLEDLFAAATVEFPSAVTDPDAIKDLMIHRLRHDHESFAREFNSVADRLADFYRTNWNALFDAAKSIGGVKLVLGGGSGFGVTQQAAVRKMLLYCDSVLVPDPVARFLEADRFDQAVPLQMAQSAYQLLQLRPLVQVEMPSLPLLLFPSLERTLEDGDARTRAGIERLTVSVVNASCGKNLGSLAEVFSFAENYEVAWLYDTFSKYIEDRRRNPKSDILTGLAAATFPDHSVPQPLDVARVAANLFAAGQETTVRLLSYAFQMIGERRDLQERLRKDRSLIPNFAEECLRVEGPVKGDFRLAKRPTKVGGVDIPAGTFLYIANSAANRDSRKFPNPGEFQIDRANARFHVAFGRGRHACPGAPLARAETVVSLNRMFDRTSDIRISEKVHGPAGARRYSYLPTFILRGLTHIQLEFDPVSGGAP